MSGPADPTTPAPLNDCPLPLGQQRWNSLCYGLYWFLFYLAAPVTYVGVTHANLVRDLGFDARLSNLPGAIYQWCMAAPILVAWLLPQPRLIKPLLVGALTLMGLISAAVGLGLGLGAPRNVVLVLVLLFGAVFGVCNGTLATLMWEIVRRGTSSTLRGRTMGLAFGLGPLFACAGSVLQQLLMGKEPLTGWSLGVAFPLNYAWLFGGAAPLIWLAAALGATFVLPAAEPVEAGPGLAVGWHSLREFFGHRPVLFAAIGYLLVYSGGNAIFANVSLYAPQALRAGQLATPSPGVATPPSATDLGSQETRSSEQTRSSETAEELDSQPQVASTTGNEPPSSTAPPSSDASASSDASDASDASLASEDDTQGLQNLLRFSFKAVTGLALGWLLASRGPRAALVATTGLLLVGMGWALQVTGWWYLITAGLLGAGELFGAYFPNYVASASSRRSVRANIALLNLLSTGVGFASVLFGWLATTYGLRSSFYAAAGLLAVALVLIFATLPRRPQPPDELPAGE
ncbi:MAG: MFS transporter [Planctomycetaceae bacterium]